MKFYKKYPTMKPIFDERDGIILGKNKGNCFICKSSTKFVEINYETTFCSEECVKRADEELFQDLEDVDHEEYR
jgi:hypothetical protein